MCSYLFGHASKRLHIQRDLPEVILCCLTDIVTVACLVVLYDVLHRLCTWTLYFFPDGDSGGLHRDALRRVLHILNEVFDAPTTKVAQERAEKIRLSTWLANEDTDAAALLAILPSCFNVVCHVVAMPICSRARFLSLFLFLFHTP